jgi:hypothetical protein
MSAIEVQCTQNLSPGFTYRFWDQMPFSWLGLAIHCALTVARSLALGPISCPVGTIPTRSSDQLPDRVVVHHSRVVGEVTVCSTGDTVTCTICANLTIKVGASRYQCFNALCPSLLYTALHYQYNFTRLNQWQIVVVSVPSQPQSPCFFRLGAMRQVLMTFPQKWCVLAPF